MKIPLYILVYICMLMILLGCSAEQLESDKAAMPEELEEAPMVEQQFKENVFKKKDELASKDYWKLGGQKVQDLVDLVEILSDSTLDSEMAGMVEGETASLLADSLISSGDILESLKNVRKIKDLKNRTELEECDQAFRCFSMQFQLKLVDGTKKKVLIHFILSEETQNFGSESEIIRKVRIQKVEDLQINMDNE